MYLCISNQTQLYHNITSTISFLYIWYYMCDSVASVMMSFDMMWLFSCLYILRKLYASGGISLTIYACCSFLIFVYLSIRKCMYVCMYVCVSMYICLYVFKSYLCCLLLVTHLINRYLIFPIRCSINSWDDLYNEVVMLLLILLVVPTYKVNEIFKMFSKAVNDLVSLI